MINLRTGCLQRPLILTLLLDLSRLAGTAPEQQPHSWSSTSVPGTAPRCHAGSQASGQGRTLYKTSGSDFHLLRRCQGTNFTGSLSQHSNLSLRSWVKAMSEDGQPLSASVLVAVPWPWDVRARDEFGFYEQKTETYNNWGWLGPLVQRPAQSRASLGVTLDW